MSCRTESEEEQRVVLVVSSKASEARCVAEAKGFTRTLEQQRRRLRALEDAPADDPRGGGEAAKLRAQLLGHRNEIAQAASDHRLALEGDVQQGEQELERRAAVYEERQAAHSALHKEHEFRKEREAVENLPKDDALLDNRRDLQKEVTAMKRGLAQQAALAAVDQMKVEESLAAEQQLLRQQETCRAQALQKSRFHYMNSVMLRDGVRCEVVKQQNVLDDLAGRREQRHLELARSNVTIGHAEERMLALRRLYASAVKSRNERGIQLIERNEEICVFQEKLNTFEHLIQNGDVEMTLSLVSQMSDVQARLREAGHRTKALISELSMYQAMSMQLHQAVKEKELAVQQAYMRLENGEPPSEDILAEWHRLVRDEARRAADRQMKADVLRRPLSAAALGVCERASRPRPNGVPPITDAQLPVPRPYGAIAPFKPAPAGANMRHVRKPQLKPIEI
ncbi:PREDICTED: coiled-coil domain-containing protein 146-like [Priapulus caudatus]|uniref:Coiled-coil domain-containing protein 146-like n=1 Tax=Priapulus caudatus TaxID=37621 RepID=A0ABM1F3D3_PRICU|nr:PREDICTED: coiled-coil domain-containing protein 146-like [Priapulus caudatus]